MIATLEGALAMLEGATCRARFPPLPINVADHDFCVAYTRRTMDDALITLIYLLS